MRGLEPARLQRVEVVVLEDRLSAPEPQQRVRADVDAEALRGRDQARTVVVDRPAETIADDVERHPRRTPR